MREGPRQAGRRIERQLEWVDGRELRGDPCGATDAIVHAVVERLDARVVVAVLRPEQIGRGEVDLAAVQVVLVVGQVEQHVGEVSLHTTADPVDGVGILGIQVVRPTSNGHPLQSGNRHADFNVAAAGLGFCILDVDERQIVVLEDRVLRLDDRADVVPRRVKRHVGIRRHLEVLGQPFGPEATLVVREAALALVEGVVAVDPEDAAPGVDQLAISQARTGPHVGVIVDHPLDIQEELLVRPQEVNRGKRAEARVVARDPRAFTEVPIDPEVAARRTDRRGSGDAPAGVQPGFHHLVIDDGSLSRGLPTSSEEECQRKCESLRCAHRSPQCGRTARLFAIGCDTVRVSSCFMSGWNVTDVPTGSVVSDIGTGSAGLNTNNADGDG